MLWECSHVSWWEGEGEGLWQIGLDTEKRHIGPSNTSGGGYKNTHSIWGLTSYRLSMDHEELTLNPTQDQDSHQCKYREWPKV